MNIPAQLKYTKDHEWISIDGEVATVGITDFAQAELGDIVFVELPQVGDELKKDQPFGSVESVKTVSELYAPISGKVVEVNAELEDSPEFVNESPYENAWMVVIESPSEAEVGELMTAEQYKEMINE